MRIALAQIASSEVPAENLELVRDYARRAAEAGADLVVFPEATMASFRTRSVDVAEPLDGEWAAGVRDAAREAGIAVVVGMFTPGGPRPDDPNKARARNTLLVADAAGEQVASYDKIHLFDAWDFVESRHVEPGDVPVLVDLGGVTIGLATCYDVRFPELFKHLAAEGAQVILVPASWANGERKAEMWRGLCVARALDSTTFVVAVGQADPASAAFSVKPGSPTGIGHSVVVGPLGEVLVEAGAAPELVVVDLDPDAVGEARKQLPVIDGTRFSITVP